MGFGDKFKDLAKQAQEAVAERKDQITEAVDRASVAADQRTGGKYSERIAKAGQKATGVVEKIAGDSAAGGEAPAPGASAAGGEAPAPGASAAGGTPPPAAEPAPGQPPAPPTEPTAPPEFG
jgi:hypothetical protein